MLLLQKSVISVNYVVAYIGLRTAWLSCLNCSLHFIDLPTS